MKMTETRGRPRGCGGRQWQPRAVRPSRKRSASVAERREEQVHMAARRTVATACSAHAVGTRCPPDGRRVAFPWNRRSGAAV